MGDRERERERERIAPNYQDSPSLLRNPKPETYSCQNLKEVGPKVSCMDCCRLLMGTFARFDEAKEVEQGLARTIKVLAGA